MAENHALVFWNVSLTDLGAAATPGGLNILNIDPDQIPGMSAYFNAGFRVTSHTVNPYSGEQGASLLVSLYLQRVVPVPDHSGAAG